jgi:hypothetical protein
MSVTHSTINTAGEVADALTLIDGGLLVAVWPFLSLYVAMPFAVAGVAYWWSWAMLVVVGYAVMTMWLIGRSA